MKNKAQPITVLVTAGPTRAYLDNVRYLSNYSSGQLGFEICRALEKKGLRVIAVVGPCDAPFDQLKKTQVVTVQTVKEMSREVKKICQQHSPQVVVLSAAVLDFEPKKTLKGKVSSKESWKIELVPTPKIIDEITRDFPEVKKVAFKLEWKAKNLKQTKSFGQKTMNDKKSQALCLNYLSEIDALKHPAFFFTEDGKVKKLFSKIEIAKEITRWVLANGSVHSGRRSQPKI